MGKLTSIVTAAALWAAPGIAGAPANLDEDQWLYRPNTSDRNHPAVAVFLSWNYSSVLFRAYCDRKNLLVIEYFGDGTPPKGGKIAIGADTSASTDDIAAKFFQLNTVLKDDGLNHILEGRIAVSPELAESITSANQIAIDAPNEMEEEWHTGVAQPLKRIVRDCH